MTDPPPPAVTAGASRAAWGAAAIALGLGLLVRVALLEDKPFWTDEARAAIEVEAPLRTTNIPLPVGFVALVKAVAWLCPWPPPEVKYRLVSLGAGLAALALLPLLARRLGASVGACLTSLWLAAGLPALVYYSRELKSYSIDLLLAVVVPLLAHVIVTGDARRRGAWPGLLFLLVTAPWVSFGGLFPIAATLAWAALRTWRQPAERRAWEGAALAWLASQAAAYVLVVQRQAANPGTMDMWRRQINHVFPGPMTLAELFVAPHATAVTYLFQRGWPLVVLLAGVGLAAWSGRGRSLLLWLWLGAAALATLAAVGNLYLVRQGRMVLFLAPPIVLLVGAGLDRLGVLLPGRWRLVAPALAAALSVWWSVSAVRLRLSGDDTPFARFFLDDVRDDVEPFIAYLEQSGVPGEDVMATRTVGWPFTYYARDRLAGATVCTARRCPDQASDMGRWLATLSSRPGWMITTSREAKLNRRILKRQGFVPREEASARGTRLWRVVRRERPAPRARARE
jgi:hypothetical protein